MRMSESFPTLRPGTLVMAHHYGSRRVIEKGGKEGIAGCFVFEVPKNIIEQINRQVRINLIIALEDRKMEAKYEVGTRICRSHLYAQSFQEG